MTSEEMKNLKMMLIFLIKTTPVIRKAMLLLETNPKEVRYYFNNFPYKVK